MIETLLVILEYVLLIAFGGAAGFVLLRFFKVQTLGAHWGAIIVGVIGGSLGNFLAFHLKTLLAFMHLYHMDVPATILGAIILVKLFNLVTPASYK